MNMLGKILVVLIFVMSIFFMAFSFMVFMTQTSWKTKAEQADTDLRNQRTANSQLENDIAKLKIERAAGNAARTSAIAALESDLSSRQQTINGLSQELNKLRSEQQVKGAQVTAAIESLQAERTKVESLQQTVKAAQAERDSIFSEVVDLKNQVLELEAIRQRLSSSEEALLAQLARQQSVLRAHDLNEHDDISNVPPKRDGRIRQVDDLNKYVVLSLGSDDGMRQGHMLDVHRGEKFLARVQLTKTHPDRSVGVVLDEFRKGAVRSGDSVRTK